MATTAKSTITLSQEQIKQRAYELYLQRGRKEGHALEDWLAAEQELKALRKEWDERDLKCGCE
jgi:hypothetical protein